MRFPRFRFIYIIAGVGLLLTWLLFFAVLTVENPRPFAFLIAASAAFFTLLLLAGFSLRWLFANTPARSAEIKSAFSTDGSVSAPQPSETRFVSQTYESVLAQLNEQQKELKKLQTQLDERAASAEAFSQHIVSGLPSGLLAFDANGLLRVINQPARDIFFDSAAGGFDKRHFTELFASHSELVGFITDTLRLNKTFSRVELDYQTRGKKLRLGLTVAPLNIKNETAGVLCLAADITEISELREQINLQRNLESLGVMSAGLAHELKNALATLHGYAQFLQRLSLDEKGRTAAAAISAEVRNLSEMINAFLNFARPETLNLTRVNLFALLKNCVVELQPLAEKASVTLKISGESVYLQADEILLRRTFLNLIRNGIEAIAGAESETREMQINCSTVIDEQRWAVIEIRDTGAGIEEKDLPFIFVPFFSTKQQGHGIGLALAHRVASQHGGLLTAANSADGAVFTLKLPLSLQEKY